MNDAAGKVAYLDPRPQDGQRPSVPSQPPLSAMGARLRPITNADYGCVYGLESDPATAVRWRHRGATPSPERVIGTLFDGVQMLVIVERVQGSPCGFVVAFGADDRNGTCHIAMVSAAGRGVGVTANYITVVPLRVAMS